MPDPRKPDPYGAALVDAWMADPARKPQPRRDDRPMSPFVRRALAAQLPAKEIR